MKEFKHAVTDNKGIHARPAVRQCSCLKCIILPEDFLEQTESL